MLSIWSNCSSSYIATFSYSFIINCKAKSSSVFFTETRSKSSLILLLVLINCISWIPSINGVNPNFSLLLWTVFFAIYGDTNVMLANLFTTVSSPSFDECSSFTGVSSSCLDSSSYSTALLIILLRIIGDEWFLIGVLDYWLFCVTYNGIFLGLPLPLLCIGGSLIWSICLYYCTALWVLTILTLVIWLNLRLIF